MKKLKVVTVVGTRPEIIRLSRLIPVLDEQTDHVFVHTGQNSDRQLNEVFFEDLELREPDYFLGVDTTSVGSVIGDTIKKIEQVFISEKPDAVMILGDTNSAVAAIIAERMQIPVYHMEAGNRSFDNNVPEELNRRMVDHVSSFNLPYNSFSYANLMNEGLHPRRTQMTGSPMREILDFYADKIQANNAHKDLGLSRGSYLLVSLHRQENVDFEENLSEVLNAIERLGKEEDLRVLVSTHPRTRKQLDKLDLVSPILEFHEPFGYFDYLNLQLNAKCVLSDSGTISEESSLLGFPAISVRRSIERPEALTTGQMVLAGLSYESIRASFNLQVSKEKTDSIPEGYEVRDFSLRVLSFLFSTATLHKNWLGLQSK